MLTEVNLRRGAVGAKRLTRLLPRSGLQRVCRSGSQEFGPVVKVDQLMKEVVRNDETKVLIGDTRWNRKMDRGLQHRTAMFHARNLDPR
jgi:hypothetical protein